MKELRLVGLIALLALPLVWASVQGSESPTEALTRALATLLLGTLPLLAAALFWQEDFRPKTVQIRFGQDRHGPAFKTLLRALLALVLASLLAAAAAVFHLRGFADPLLGRDLLATLPVAIAGALSIGCLLAAARAWLGKLGLAALVVLSWFAGQSDFIIRVALPSGHLRTLLGIGDPLPFDAWLSFLVLYLIALVSSGLLSVRVPR